MRTTEPRRLISADRYNQLLCGFAASIGGDCDGLSSSCCCLQLVNAWAARVGAWDDPASSAACALRRLNGSTVKVHLMRTLPASPWESAISDVDAVHGFEQKFWVAKVQIRDLLRARERSVLDPHSLFQPAHRRPNDRFWPSFWAGSALLLARHYDIPRPVWALDARPLGRWVDRTSAGDVDAEELGAETPEYGRLGLYFDLGLPPGVL